MTRVKNWFLLCGWSVLAWFGLSGKQIAENEAANRAVLDKHRLWPLGGYIERQCDLGELRFGKAFTMAYGGCGLIAVYNALVALGRETSDELFLEVTAGLQRKGVAWFGRYGTHPAAIRHLLVRYGYRVMRLKISEESFAQNEEDYKVFIVTVLNGSGLQNGIHTVCITREEAGFVVHNGPGNAAFTTLMEAVRNTSRRGATPVYAMGIKDHRDYK